MNPARAGDANLADATVDRADRERHAKPRDQKLADFPARLVMADGQRRDEGGQVNSTSWSWSSASKTARFMRDRSGGASDFKRWSDSPEQLAAILTPSSPHGPTNVFSVI